MSFNLDRMKKMMDDKSRKKNPRDEKHTIPNPDKPKKEPYTKEDGIWREEGCDFKSTYTQEDHKKRRYSSQWLHQTFNDGMKDWRHDFSKEFGIPEEILQDEFIYSSSKRGGKSEQIRKDFYEYFSRPTLKPNPEHKSTDLVLLYCSHCKEYVHENQVIKVRSGQICGRCIASAQQERTRRHG